jgi:hypothetical protein
MGMNGKGRYKFKVINGILSWKNMEMERYMPVSAEILTRVILLYEKEIKNGLDLWNEIEQEQKRMIPDVPLSRLYEQLVNWMEQLQGIFGDTDPFREKDKWTEDYRINLN